MTSRPPLYLLLGKLLAQQECADVMARPTDEQWMSGVTFGGGGRQSDVCWLDDPAWLRRFLSVAQAVAPLLGLAVDPEGLDSLQLARYKPGEHYGWHIDHDTSREVVPVDRKLSIVMSLSDGGGLDLEHAGSIGLNAGDAIAFPSLLSHQAPTMEHERYSLTAWVTGPYWR